MKNAWELPRPHRSSPLRLPALPGLTDGQSCPSAMDIGTIVMLGVVLTSGDARVCLSSELRRADRSAGCCKTSTSEFNRPCGELWHLGGVPGTTAGKVSATAPRALCGTWDDSEVGRFAIGSWYRLGVGIPSGSKSLHTKIVLFLVSPAAS